jgi:hypothetical protein
MTTPSEEVAALEAADAWYFGGASGHVFAGETDSKHLVALRRLAKLHAARLAVVEAAKRLRAKGPGYASMDLDAAVDALLALEAEIEKGAG